MHWESNPHLSKGLCGSEPYIAPEQFITSKEYDARLVDVWACGIVYYCMMYQGIPFRMAAPSDPNYLTYLEQRVLGQYEPFERLSSGCRDLMYHILEPDPCMRYDIDRIKADSWFKSIEICSDGSKTTKEHHHIAPEFLNKNKPPTKTKF
jgi:protein-serine/threonine kinase